MSAPNPFRHQAYTDAPPDVPWQLLRAEIGPSAESPEYAERLARIGRVLREARVGRIVLVHGTFVGADASGLLGEFGRWFPLARDTITQRLKALIDGFKGDRGNYTAAFAEQLAAGVNQHGGPPIEVGCFHWSSENNHLGRADAMVRLLAELVRDQPPPGQRVLLWGHSHGGNVLALLTLLLAADAEARARFFEAARIFYRHPRSGQVDVPAWQEAATLLAGDSNPLAACPLDMVTFGTPVRYGWSARGAGRLLHVLHHRPVSGWPEHRVPFPPTFDDLLVARSGDYIQQFGIAGTDLPPSILAWRARLADRQLQQLIAPNMPPREFWIRLDKGVRMHDTGLNLLVDYGPQARDLREHSAGHSLYTQQSWLLFHAETVARCLYEGEPG